MPLVPSRRHRCAQALAQATVDRVVATRSPALIRRALSPSNRYYTKGTFAYFGDCRGHRLGIAKGETWRKVIFPLEMSQAKNPEIFRPLGTFAPLDHGNPALKHWAIVDQGAVII